MSYKNEIQKLIDFYLLNNFVCKIVSNFNKKNKSVDKPKRIIIYKLGQIGDSVLLLPAIKAIKHKTHADISVACGEDNFRVFKNQKFIKNLFCLKKGPSIDWKVYREIKKMNFDLAIDTTQSSSISSLICWRTAKYSIGFENTRTYGRNRVYDKTVSLNPLSHMVKNYFDLCGLEYAKQKLVPMVTETPSKEILSLLKKRFVCIHASSPIAYKNWSIENFAKVSDYLSQKNYSVLLVGSKGEAHENQKLIRLVKENNRKNIIDLTGQTNLNELAFVLSKARFLVANDGGVMHMGASMNCPTLGLFSIEDPIRYGPFNAKSRSIYHEKIAAIRAYEYIWPNESKCKNIMGKITLKEVLIGVKKLEI